MGRKVEYYCDECDSVFGDSAHINIKNGDIRMSYRNRNMPGGARWLQKKFSIPCHEYHFCDNICLSNWLKKEYDAAKKDIETKV